VNFLEAFEAPIVEKIGGVAVSFPVLSIDDYAPWVAEIAAARKQVAKASIPRAIDPQTKLPTLLNPTAQWSINQRIENIECGLEDVAEKVWTLAGARRVLTMSLAKAGLSEEDQKQVLARIKPVRLHALAVEVSGLFEAKPEAEKADAKPAEGQPDPNSNLPAVNQQPTGATGS